MSDDAPTQTVDTSATPPTAPEVVRAPEPPSAPSPADLQPAVASGAQPAGAQPAVSTQPAVLPQQVTEGSGTDPALTAAMDRVSLDQALIDFGIANSRVLDLTRRLTSLTEEVARLQDENARLRIAVGRLRDLEGTSAYQALRGYRAGTVVARKFLIRLRRR